MFFYNRSEEVVFLESRIQKKIDEFVLRLGEDEGIGEWIDSFGILGPCSRGQGFYIDYSNRSDVDFYLISKSINIFKLKKIYALFNSVFDEELDCSLLYASPTIFKKPDLMLFEYSYSEVVCWGRKIANLDLKEVSKLEVLRNIVYRGGYFLKLFEVYEEGLKLRRGVTLEELSYAFSKIVFAKGEIELILNGKYVADNFIRDELCNDELHRKAHDFRYFGKEFGFSKEELVSRGFLVLFESYKLIFRRFLVSDLKNVRGENYLWNVFFFNFKFFLKFMRFSSFKEEPFVFLTFKFYSLIQKVVRGEVIFESELDEVLFCWKNVPWFFFKI